MDKNYKLEKDSEGWYWFRGKNYKQAEDVSDEELFEDNEITELLKLVLYDPKDDLVTRILYALDTIIPEGARVRSPMRSANSVAIIASENPIGEEQKNKVEEMVSEYV